MISRRFEIEENRKPKEDRHEKLSQDGQWCCRHSRTKSVSELLFSLDLAKICVTVTVYVGTKQGFIPSLTLL